MIHLFSHVTFIVMFDRAEGMALKKACNRSYACLLFRLPPSDLHTQQAQNSPRLMSVNLLPSCPRVLKIGGIQKEENKSIKAQYLKV